MLTKIEKKQERITKQVKRFNLHEIKLIKSSPHSFLEGGGA